ncbi:MAG: aconitase X catalytic domain-containing protein [Thermodesulfobacteriota bacterium]
MYLNDEEKAMLAGEMGEGVRLAMKVLVGIGEALGAGRMVPITRAHVALSNQEADTWFAEKLRAAGALCRVPPTVNPGFCLSYFQAAGMIQEADRRQMERTYQVYKDLGARLSFSCTPYLLDNIPHQGELVAFSESSATPYVNSVWGARSNRESSQSALCAAVAGRVPEYGLLLPENRRATAEVEVRAELAEDYDYSLLGWLAPRLIGPHIPVFNGITRPPSPEALMNLGAELNTAGATPMYHLAGITPEARTLDQALSGRTPELRVEVTAADLAETRRNLFEPGGSIEFVMFGCPHHTLRQVREVAKIVEGRRLKAELWLLTSNYTREMARRMGLAQIIEAAGGKIVPDTCVDQPTWRHLAGKKGATDSPKCAYYTKRRDLRFVVRSLRECAEAAVTGVIQ